MNQAPPHHRRWAELNSLFDQLIGLESTARASRLSAIEETDAELHATLHKLLEADNVRPPVLDHGVREIAGDVVGAFVDCFRKDGAADILARPQ